MASDEVISAICGNWWQESTLNPGLYEGRKEVPLLDNNVYGGYGLGQWTNAPKLGLTRRTQLVTWLRSNGYADDSGPGQLAFFITENTWYRNGYGAAYNSLSDFLNTSDTDLRDLTYAFMQGWEGIWDGTEGIRYDACVKVYEFIQTKDPDSVPEFWNVSNQYLSEEARLVNAYQIYRYLSGDTPPGPGPGPGPIRRKRKQIWRLIRYK